MLIADTVKGAGVSFFEPQDLPVAGDSLYDFHSGAPSPDQYERALAELRERLERRVAAIGAGAVELVEAAGSDSSVGSGAGEGATAEASREAPRTSPSG